MKMEEVHDKHNIWLVRALRDTVVNLHLSHDTLATVNSLSTCSPECKGFLLLSVHGEGVLVPVSEHQDAKAFTHKSTNTDIFTHIHLQTHAVL